MKHHEYNCDEALLSTLTDDILNEEEAALEDDDHCLGNHPHSKTLKIGKWTVLKETVEHQLGNFDVYIHGKNGGVGGCGSRNIVTYHDLGLDFKSNFHDFFSMNDLRMVLDEFCFYHITAPGMDSHSNDSVEVQTSTYPATSLEHLSSQVKYTLEKYSIKNFIGFGVGLGGYVMTCLAVDLTKSAISNHRNGANTSSVDGLVLINCDIFKSSWMDWCRAKLASHALKKQQNDIVVTDAGTSNLPMLATNYLWTHHFGNSSSIIASDAKDNRRMKNVVQTKYREGLLKSIKLMNRDNLASLILLYADRPAINLPKRQLTFHGKLVRGNENQFLIKCPVLNITGQHSQQAANCLSLNERLSPETMSWLEVKKVGSPLFEGAQTVCDAFKLFLKGLGHTFIK